MPPEAFASRVDHTILRAETTRSDVRRVCDEALEFGFASVCVPLAYIEDAVTRLAGSSVRPTTVVGFPLGHVSTQCKVHEVTTAAAAGARELDMVLQIGALRAGETDFVLSDIAVVTRAAHDAGLLIKVIIEAALLNDAQKRLACRCVVEAGADFVKTSTGFGPGGATVEDVRLLRECVGAHARVKAAGGIRDAKTALGLIAAGADRLGMSSSVAVVRELMTR